MEQQTPMDAGGIGPDDLMRYLDGEMTPEERDQVDTRLDQSTELQRELAMYRALKEDVQGLTFRTGPTQHSVWDDVNRSLNRPMGFAFLIAGLLIWLTYGTFLFATLGFSFIYSLCLFPTMLGLIGPENKQGTFPHIMALLTCSNLEGDGADESVSKSSGPAGCGACCTASTASWRSRPRRIGPTGAGSTTGRRCGEPCCSGCCRPTR